FYSWQNLSIFGLSKNYSMKIKHLTLLSLFLLSAWSCKDKQETKDTPKYTAEEMKDNPLVQESTLPYGAPDFTKIKDEHFKPALEYALQVETEAIGKIAGNPEEPTFENTLVEMEKANALYDRVVNVFYALTGANTNETLKELESEMAPKLAAHRDNILLNEKLFARIKTLYDKRAESKLEGKDLKLLEVKYQDFVKAGANLSDEKKDALKEINARLASLENEFGQILLEATNDAALVIRDTARLKGLTSNEISSLKVEGKTEWKIPIQNTTQQPLMQSIEDRQI